MTRRGPLSQLACYFNLCWPLPVILQRSSPKTMGETVPEHVSVTWKHRKTATKRVHMEDLIHFFNFWTPMMYVSVRRWKNIFNLVRIHINRSSQFNNASTMLVILMKRDTFKNVSKMCVQHQSCPKIPPGCPDALEGNLRPKLHDTAHCKVNNKAIS